MTIKKIFILIFLTGSLAHIIGCAPATEITRDKNLIGELHNHYRVSPQSESFAQPQTFTVCNDIYSCRQITAICLPVFNKSTSDFIKFSPVKHPHSDKGAIQHAIRDKKHCTKFKAKLLSAPCSNSF